MRNRGDRALLRDHTGLAVQVEATEAGFKRPNPLAMGARPSLDGLAGARGAVKEAEYRLHVAVQAR
eukprot:1266761-Lingulodinium_polyedra.AAC.1